MDDKSLMEARQTPAVRIAAGALDDGPVARTHSAAVRSGDWIFVGGDRSVSEPASPKSDYVLVDRQAEESKLALRHMKEALSRVGGSLERDVVRIYQWFANSEQPPSHTRYGQDDRWLSITPYLNTRNEFISEPRPASSAISVLGVTRPSRQVGVDAIAVVAEEGVKHGIGVAPGAPRPLAGYSPVITVDDWVFLAGTMPVDWLGDYGAGTHLGTASGLAPDARVNPYYWYGSPIETQTRHILEVLKARAESAGSSLGRAVRATVYLKDRRDFVGLDRVWREYFPTNPPARVVIPSCGFGGAGVLVEISLKLLTGTSHLEIETIEAREDIPVLGHEPHAVRVGHLVFLSTQTALGAEGGIPEELQPYTDADLATATWAQTDLIMSRVASILSAADTSLENVCRRQAFVSSLVCRVPYLSAWSAATAALPPPTSTTIQLSDPSFVPSSNILLDLIAHVDR